MGTRTSELKVCVELWAPENLRKRARAISDAPPFVPYALFVCGCLCMSVHVDAANIPVKMRWRPEAGESGAKKPSQVGVVRLVVESKLLDII